MKTTRIQMEDKCFVCGTTANLKLFSKPTLKTKGHPVTVPYQCHLCIKCEKERLIKFTK